MCSTGDDPKCNWNWITFCDCIWIGCARTCHWNINMRDRRDAQVMLAWNGGWGVGGGWWKVEEKGSLWSKHNGSCDLWRWTSDPQQPVGGRRFRLLPAARLPQHASPHPEPCPGMNRNIKLQTVIRGATHKMCSRPLGFLSLTASHSFS